MDPLHGNPMVRHSTELLDNLMGVRRGAKGGSYPPPHAAKACKKQQVF
jgi:hypothetical protein